MVAVTASAHSPVPPPSAVMPPPPLPPTPDDGGFGPSPRPPSMELGRALTSSQQHGRQLAHSATIVGSGSIVGSVASASIVPSRHRRELQTSVSNGAGLTSATSVSTSAGLTSALANTAVGRIVLAPGNYMLSGQLGVTRSIVLEAAVAGSAVLDAQASSSSQRRVLNINPGPSGVVQLIGLNITGGYIQDPGAGGVLVNSGTVSIASSQIYGNIPGGISVNGGTVSLINCQVFSNQVSGNGGGVVVNGGTVSIISCRVYSNQCAPRSEYSLCFGGGVNVQGGTVTISSSSIYGNTASSGAGVYVHDSGDYIISNGGVAAQVGRVSIISSQIYSNTASDSYGRDGGGVNVQLGTVTISSSSIYGNTANSGGGGVAVQRVEQSQSSTVKCIPTRPQEAAAASMSPTLTIMALQSRSRRPRSRCVVLIAFL